MPDLTYEPYPEKHYAIFRMTRPDRLNAQGAQMREDLDEALMEFTQDPDMRVGVVTGEGRAFSAGADLREMAERNAAVVSSAGPSEERPIPPPELRSTVFAPGNRFPGTPSLSSPR